MCRFSTCCFSAPNTPFICASGPASCILSPLLADTVLSSASRRYWRDFAEGKGLLSWVCWFSFPPSTARLALFSQCQVPPGCSPLQHLATSPSAFLSPWLRLSSLTGPRDGVDLQSSWDHCPLTLSLVSEPPDFPAMQHSSHLSPAKHRQSLGLSAPGSTGLYGGPPAPSAQTISSVHQPPLLTQRSVCSAAPGGLFPTAFLTRTLYIPILCLHWHGSLCTPACQWWLARTLEGGSCFARW